MRADHGSYFITMYMKTEATGEKKKKKKQIDNKTSKAKHETK